MQITTRVILVIFCLTAISVVPPLWAAEKQSAEELAKRVQNPVADLISNFPIGLGERFVFFNFLPHPFQHGDRAGGVDFGKLLVDLTGRFGRFGPCPQGDQFIFIG